jgi:hypothetical protein
VWYCVGRAGALMVGVLMMVGGLVSAAEAVPARADMILGVTFSPRYAGGLDLDPRATYIAMLDQLGVRSVRLPLYWEEVEAAPGVFDFSDSDFYVHEAAARGVTLIVSVGYKQPRWPECYPPRWASSLSAEQLQQHVLRLVEAEVTHVRQWPQVAMWQVENEPFVRFGNCDSPVVLTPTFVGEEIDLIHSLDNRRVLVTDSGEWSTLVSTMSTTDVDLGLSVYRDVPLSSFGLSRYPLPAWSYTVKNGFARAVTGADGMTIISELQCEPWFVGGGLKEVPYEVQRSQFPPEEIVLSNIEYARRTQFSRAYLWGVEWWYWMASRGHPEYVEAARQAFATQTAV